MAQPVFTESTVESAALAWLEALGYEVRHGPEIAAGEPDAERSDPNYRDVVLGGRLRQALARLNPALPSEALDDAFKKLTRLDAPSLLERNRAAHRMLVDGVTVEYPRPDGSIAGYQARVIDFEDPDNNDWGAVNQFTVSEGQHTRRPDVVFFVNELPLAVIELKNPTDENATVWSAWRQLETYQGRSHPSSPPTRRWWSPTVSRHVSARSGRARSGSNPGARSQAKATRQPRCPSSRWCWRGSSTSAASSIWCATSSSSRMRGAGSSSRAQVIEELIQLAKDLREADRRGEELGLSEDMLLACERFRLLYRHPVQVAG